MLVPICAALYLGQRFLDIGARPSRRERPRPPRPLGRALRDTAIVAPASALFIWAVYGFEVASLAGDRELALHPRAAAARAAIAELPAWLRELGVPAYSFFKGFALQSFHAANQSTWTGGYNHQFLFGANSPDGWWYYFPLALAVKAPLAFFALLGWAAVVLRRRPAGRPRPPVELVLLILPALLWLGTCMLLTINIGIRYLLPMIPLLAILIGALGPAIAGRRLPPPSPRAAGLAGPRHRPVLPPRARPLQRAGRRHRRRLALPQQLVDRLGPGPARPDPLPRRHHIEAPYLDYFGGIDPQSWGLRSRPLPTARPPPPLTGVLVVSQSRLTARGPHEALYRQLRTQAPIAKLGWTLFVYRLP